MSPYKLPYWRCIDCVSPFAETSQFPPLTPYLHPSSLSERLFLFFPLISIVFVLIKVSYWLLCSGFSLRQLWILKRLLVLPRSEEFLSAC
jgi:hypothetical protein